MFETLIRWYRKYLSNPEVVTLIIISIATLGVFSFLGRITTPLIISITLAYLLECPILYVKNLGFSHTWAIAIILVLFISIFLLIIFAIFPIVWQQGTNLVHDIPIMLNKFSEFITILLHRYPVLTNIRIIDMIIENIHSNISIIGKSLVKYSINSLTELLILIVYLVLIPLIIFFIIRDKTRIFNILFYIFPNSTKLIQIIWKEMNRQITNYIYGKLLEMIIIGIISWIEFLYFKLRYSLLLAIMVSLSVLVPYIGIIFVTIPIIWIALFQFGYCSYFWKCIITYLVTQILDGYLLVPLLFSEVVDLHPLIIILSVIIFGELWGFWGVFFAIPLATFIKTIIYLWPKII